MGEYTRFKGDSWTVNNNFEASACITSQSDTQFTVKGTFRTESDYIGVFWNSEDLITHDLLAYPTDTDYTGVVLAFKATWTNTKSLLDDTLNLVITQVDGTEKYIPLNHFCTQSGSTYGRFTINFDDLTDVNYSIDYGGSEVNYNVKIDITQIKSIMIPIIPTIYTPPVTETLVGAHIYHFSMIDPINFELEVSHITVTNGFLGYEPLLQLTHDYRLAEGYDDTYNLCPRRLAYMASRLKYTEWLDVYIGATHYYEKSGISGAPARSSTDINTPVYSNMTLDTSVPLNIAFSTWFDDYCKWSKSYGMENIIVSISMENLQMPNAWKQLLHDGTPGGTGWVPSTNFFSPTNTEARAYVRSVAEACLDILVDHGLPPILQWGEPWWWWQELYPESISIDPNNQNTSSEAYPGQPPAFYDQSTKDKYYNETGEQLPVYTSSQDEYDPEVIAWLRNQLIDYSNFMRSIVKAYTGGKYTVLYFPPSIFDTDRVPPMMQEVNYPVDAWNNGQLDFLQLEDYDWVISDDPQHETIWNFGQKMNIPNSRVHYFAGYCQYPANAKREWALIRTALEEAVANNMAEVFVWAGTQIRRDNIILSAPLPPREIIEDTEPAIPLLNIIVLNEREEVIKWLIPDNTEITEINETNKIKRVTLTYPLTSEELGEDSNPWFMQGNKIFIPSVFGLKNCLYVINTSYKLDYWKENTVTVEVEEVLTELNNQVVAVYEDTKINKEQLTNWFGEFYEIDTIDELLSNKNSIKAQGNVTLMNLYRTIEENTDRVFITDYTYENNHIIRRLSLLKESTLRQTAGTEYLDLNYNLDSLELEVDEEKTYTAVAPLLSIQNTSNVLNNSNNEKESANYITVTENDDDVETSKTVYNNWLELEVQHREYIPMIRKKGSDGTVTTTAYWYAPFEKQKGKPYIEHTGYSNSHYNTIIPLQHGENIPNPLPKLGTVSTSETDPYGIYNVLANHLLDKLNINYKISLKVKDITDRLGLENLGYNIYETLYVKVPGFTYYIPAYITKTTKNPHLPGNDSITIETDIKNTHLMKDSNIISQDKIIPADNANASIGGILISEDSDPIPSELISINVRLVEAYTTANNPTPSVNEFKPAMEEYIFSKEEIWELEKNLRHDSITGGIYDDYVLTDVKGDSYVVPIEWCLGIYYTLIQIYINNDFPTGVAKWKDTVAVKYYPNAISLIREKGGDKYMPSVYYYYIQFFRNYYKELGLTGQEKWNNICSNEIQDGPTCIASAMSNATAFCFNYYSEGQVKKLLGTDGGLLIREIDSIGRPALRKMGFKTEVIQITRDNIKKYINYRSVALVSCWSKDLGYNATNGHEILLYAWREVNGVLTVLYFDSNHPIFDPPMTYLYDLKTTNTIEFSKLKNAVYATVIDGHMEETRNNNASKYMIVIQQDVAQLPDKFKDMTVSPSVVVKPGTVGYTFTSNEIERVWSSLLRLKSTDSFTYYNSKHNITTKTGTVVQLEALWVYSLASAYMSFFNETNTARVDKDITTGSNSSANIMYKYITEEAPRKNLELKQFTIANPKVFNNQNKVLVSTALFWLGKFKPAHDITYSYSDDGIMSLTNIGNIISSYVSDISFEVLPVSNTNLHTALNAGLAITYITRAEALALGGHASLFDDTGKSSVPVFLDREEDGKTHFVSTQHVGVRIGETGLLFNSAGTGNKFYMATSDFISNISTAIGGILVINYDTEG